MMTLTSEPSFRLSFMLQMQNKWVHLGLKRRIRCGAWGHRTARRTRIRRAWLPARGRRRLAARGRTASALAAETAVPRRSQRPNPGRTPPSYPLTEARNRWGCTVSNQVVLLCLEELQIFWEAVLRLFLKNQETICVVKELTAVCT